MGSYQDSVGRERLIYDGHSGGHVEVNEILAKLLVIIERSGNNFSAYAPDLPGCMEETESEIREAIGFHIAGLREDGLPLPLPTSQVEYVEVAA